MEEKYIQDLISKYLIGKASIDEKKELEAWYSSKLESTVDFCSEDTETEIKNRIQSSILNSHKFNKDKKSYRSLTVYISSLAATILLALGFYSLILKQKQTESSIITPISQTENRHILLSDSSIVILRPGGKLLVDADFGKNNRSIELIGEAYFDIKPNKNKPFIIRSGKYTTRVLGTAFSIKSLEKSDEFTLVVDHGTVQVEKQKKIIGILHQNDKLTASSTKALEKPIKLKEELSHDELAWKDDDMVFHAIEFGELAKKLERRYGVKIKFSNPELSKCRMTGVFSGTEILEEVLSNLCLTSNTHFSKSADNEFIIDGKKCFN